MLSAMKNPFKTFEPNTEGRDFVIGDLHGSMPCFENLLKNLNFDETKDRMFSVGDLVDRGPDSLGCLRLLLKSWFHSVLSNHEQMMLEAFTGGYMGHFWLRNGGSWGHDAFMFARELEKQASQPDYPLEHLSDEAIEIIDLQSLVEELPYLITVNMPDGKKFHIIHAELPFGYAGHITDATLSSPSEVQRLANVHTRDDGEFMLWGRFIFANFYRAQMNNVDKIKRTIAYKYQHSMPFNDDLSHIISGHTIVQRPITILGQTNIDTCAHGSCSSEPASYEALTCVNLHEWKFYQATPTEFREVEPIEVNKDDIAALHQEFNSPNKARSMNAPDDLGGTESSFA
jgi:serine/threonine protein phosphatase 1